MVLHVLLHMSERQGPMTSEQLAGAMHTNPVVVRRTLAGLRTAGLVRSEKGHGGGWTLAQSLNCVSLLDVHRALGEPDLIAIGHRSENPGCLVEKVVQNALDSTLQEAESLLQRRLATITLADLASDFQRRHAEHKRSHAKRVSDQGSTCHEL
jgi:Rrf2 family protein